VHQIYIRYVKLCIKDVKLREKLHQKITKNALKNAKSVSKNVSKDVWFLPTKNLKAKIYIKTQKR
jgi:hypothetical protein